MVQFSFNRPAVFGPNPCGSTPSTRRSGTARRARPSRFRSTTSSLIAQKLDELGIDYIEGGWPGSNPKDKEFFARAPRPDAHARPADRVRRHPACAQVPRATRTRACRRSSRPSTPVVSIFGKTWDLHVRTRARHHARGEPRSSSPRRSSYLKDHGKEVIYDAEHFFDGYKANPRLRAAHARSRARRRAPTCSASATPTAAPRRIASARDRGRRAPAVRRRHRHPHAQRLRRGRGQRARGRRGRRDARAGLHERLRRALRQRQSRVDHRQPRAEARPHDHRAGKTGEPDAACASSSRSWPICRFAATSRSSARAPLRTRAACT